MHQHAKLSCIDLRLLLLLKSVQWPGNKINQRATVSDYYGGSLELSAAGLLSMGT